MDVAGKLYIRIVLTVSLLKVEQLVPIAVQPYQIFHRYNHLHRWHVVLVVGLT